MAEKMKPSGIGWLGDIPGSWNVKPLKYLAECNQRVLFENTRPDYRFRYVDIGSVSYENGVEEYQEMAFEDAPSRARRLVNVGDTIISTVRTYLKAIALVDDEKDVVVSTGFAVYHPQEKIEPRFLYYFCKSEGFVQEIDKLSYGIAYPAINTDLLNRIVVSYPELSEQGAIADYLDAQCAKIDSIIVDIKKQIETLQKYKKSLITEVVTKGLDRSVPMKDIEVACIGFVPASWKYKKLGYMAEVTKLAGFEFTDYFEYVDEGVIAIRGLNLKNFDISLADIQHIPVKISDMLPRSQVHNNDVLISYAGTVGSIGLITDTDRRYHLAPNVGKVTIQSELIPRYLAYYLISYAGQEHIDQLKNKNAQESISMENIRRIKVLVPPQVEQQTICDYLDKKTGEIDDLISGQQKKLELIQAHKKSLIYEYVTGKKRVTEVN